MKDLRAEIQAMKEGIGLVERVYCKTGEDRKLREMARKGEKLPEDIAEDGVGYFRYIVNDLTKGELDEYYRLRRLSYLKAIRNGVILIAVLAIISMVFIIFFGGVFR